MRTCTRRRAVFSRLPTPFPYMTIMPQSRFLEFVTAEAQRYPHFRLILGANVDRLVEDDGIVRGVGYRSMDGRGEVRAPLTVATDGRFSRVRKLARLEPVIESATMEVLWLRLPRRPEVSHEHAGVSIGRRETVAVLARTHEWQLGYVGPKGRYHALKEAGLDALRQALVEVLPWLGDRVAALVDWSDVSLLSVEGSRLTRWHRPGLLLIGDAAHVMLPIAGVGITCAIADAVEAANVLTRPLREARVQEADLAAVQRRRERVTRILQRFQARLLRGILANLRAGSPPRVPLPVRIILRVPGLRNLPGRIVAFGVRRVRIEHPEEAPPPSQLR